MKYSTVIPAYNAEKTIWKCIESVPARQDNEVIVIDDASTDSTDSIVEGFSNITPNVILSVHGENQQKVISRNEGMYAASGEWITWLDADDYYLPFYLDVIDQAIIKYPEAKVFYFGGLVCWSRWDITLRLPNEVHQGDVFRSGAIMSGGFVFKKECLDKVGYLPESRNCYAFGQQMLDKYPEIKPLYKQGQLDLGNPWGDDWAMFYKLTRDYEPQLLNVTTYVVMTREEHQL